MARINSRKAPQPANFSAMALPYASVSLHQRPVALTPEPAAAAAPEKNMAPSLVGRILPVKAMAQRYSDVVSEGALRHLIWQAEAYAKDPKSGLKSNGFLSVIVRPPGQRKVLLDCVEFEKWLTSQRRGGQQ